MEHACTYDWIQCSNMNNYNISSYLITNVNGEINSIDIRLDMTPSLTWCAYEGIYYFYASVTISCDIPENASTAEPTTTVGSYSYNYNSSFLWTTCNDSDFSNDVLLTIQMDLYPEELSWTLSTSSSSSDYDNSDTVESDLDVSNFLNHSDFWIVDSGEHYKQFELISDNICADDGCFELSFYDSFGDGIMKYGGWFSLMVNEQYVTFDNRQSFDDSQVSIYFCTQLFDKFHGTDTNINYNNLTIIIDYDTKIAISNVTAATNDIVYYNIINSDYNNDNIFLSVPNGCYQIEFYDSDTSDTTFSNDASSYGKHGSYIIYMNDNVAAFGGYYGQLETKIICTDLNHASFCIIPQYCEQNDDIFVIDYEMENNGGLNGFSYESLKNTKYPNSDFDITEINSANLNINCLGSFSCENSETNISSLHCYGAFSCLNVNWYIC